MRRARAALVLGAALLAAACSATNAPTGCHADADCKGDRICEQGACVSPSTSTGTGGAGTGGAGTGGSATSGILCTDMPVSNWCVCTHVAGGGNDAPCSPAQLPGIPSLCCATDGWPDQGECYCDGYTCEGSNGSSCHCGIDVGSPGATCAPEPGWTCCADARPHQHWCACAFNTPDCTELTDNNIQVPTCDLQYIGCGPGAHAVTACR